MVAARPGRRAPPIGPARPAPALPCGGGRVRERGLFGLSTLELEKQGATGACGAVFQDVPTVGFSTYGECYLGHINQTATMLLVR